MKRFLAFVLTAALALCMAVGFAACGEDEVAVESVTLSSTSLSLTVGEEATLTATVAPDNATDKTVTWSSSAEAVATVAEGKVTAVAAGSAVITATAGEKSASCTVTVTAAAENSGESDKTEETQSTANTKLTETEWKSAIQATVDATCFYAEITVTSDNYKQVTVYAVDENKVIYVSEDIYIINDDEETLSHSYAMYICQDSTNGLVVYEKSYDETSETYKWYRYSTDEYEDIDEAIESINDIYSTLGLEGEIFLEGDDTVAFKDLYSAFTYDEETDSYSGKLEYLAYDDDNDYYEESDYSCDSDCDEDGESDDSCVAAEDEDAAEEGEEEREEGEDVVYYYAYVITFADGKVATLNLKAYSGDTRIGELSVVFTYGKSLTLPTDYTEATD